MGKASVAIVGATGYAGAELVRLLRNHPCAEVHTVTSSRNSGKPLREECPWLASELYLQPFDPNTLHADITFLCQESGFAMQHVPELRGKTRVIDLSADYRLNDKNIYQSFYNIEHADPDASSVYGLPELVESSVIAEADLVANPGCYPTASLLGLMPLVQAGLVTSTPVIDAKSGVSGAGRSRKETEYLFTELEGGFRAYGALRHRHLPEIEQMAGMNIRFTPHLVPMTRGIEATIHVPIREKIDVAEIFRDFYRSSAFVSIQTDPPNTKQVVGTNRCVISAQYDERTGFAVVFSVIDNLVKGAAGQAIQNMNLMLGLDETTALPMDGLWP